MATIGSNAAYVPGCQHVLFLNPEHAAIVAAAGWSKDDVRRYLFDVARVPSSRLTGRGLAPIWPQWFHGLEHTPVLTDPSDLLIAVAGGAGPASQVAIPWGYSRAVTLPVR